MIVGFMRNQKSPGKTIRAIAELCKEQGIDLIYFNAENVRRKRNKVKGKVLMDSKWSRVEVDIPEIIDISPLCAKHKKVTEYLKEHAYLTDNLEKILNDVHIYDMLIDNEELMPYAIPTKIINQYMDILNFLKEYEVVKIQALFKHVHNGEFLITYSDRNVQVTHKEEVSTFNLSEFETWCNNIINGKTFIVQQYIPFEDQMKQPFYCRVHLDKDGHNSWTHTSMNAYVGDVNADYYSINDKTDIEEYLLKGFSSDQVSNILAQLQTLSIKIAQETEVYRGHDLVTVAIDFGLTLDGDIYVMKANNSPFMRDEIDVIAPKRVGYYTYLIDKLELN